ncbi:hypothetical protein CEXT_802411, partial [Caerostris extrusa]
DLADSRRLAVAAFRLNCLHGIYLHLTSFHPNCVLCRRDTVMDALHLKECPEVFGHLYDRYR